MLGIAILFSLCCPFRSTLPGLLAAPYTLLRGGNDMRHRRAKGPRVLRGIRKAEGHVVEGRWERYFIGEDGLEFRQGYRIRAIGLMRNKVCFANEKRTSLFPALMDQRLRFLSAGFRPNLS